MASFPLTALALTQTPSACLAPEQTFLLVCHVWLGKRRRDLPDVAPLLNNPVESSPRLPSVLYRPVFLQASIFGPSLDIMYTFLLPDAPL